MNKYLLICLLLCLCGATQAQLSTPEYHKGIALLTGKVENYNPKEELKFMIGAPNIVMGTAETLYPSLNADGSFSISIPLYHATQVRIMVGGTDQTTLLSPNKETSININLNNLPGKQFVYSGEYASINNELSQPELKKGQPAIYHHGDKLDAIQGISANELKQRCISEYQSDIAHNNTQQQFSEDARTLANLMCAYACLHNLQAAHYCLQTAYQKKNNITRDQAFAAFMDIHLPDDFYDCLSDFPVNHPLSLYCYYYREVLMTYYTTRNEPFAYEQYMLKHAPLTKEEQTLIHQRQAAFKAGNPFQQHGDLMALSIKYKKENEQHQWQSFTNAKENIIRIMGDSTCLFVDYLRALYMRSSFYNFKPLNAQQEKVASCITHPILLGIIQDMNQQMQPRKKASATPTEKKSIVCQAPQAPDNEILTAILARHKGKVQFVDFWATWCGGCRQIIKEYEPLKQEMTEDKVAFIYLTGPSSVEATWNILIPNIAGEHYWLSKNQWNYLWKEFQMSGLPMYLIIDKKGNIVKKFTHITAKELKDLLQQEINK